ncbi:hypothetical protein IJ531_01185, partial [bacterium]|nr:hypothetical protein [bacterium]
MINAIVTDKNQSSKELIHSYLKEMDGIGDVYCFDDLNSIDCDLKKIDIVLFDVNSQNEIETLVIVDELKNK